MPFVFQRFIGDITKFFGIDLNNTGINSKLQPSVGVSFGLPNQQANQYAGQPQNFLGTGSGVNPYPASGGISVGAVDINPLVSFQATTNDEGEIVNKPLINLHVTPNGCGLFGCEDEFAPSIPEFFGGNRRHQNKNIQYEQLTPVHHQQNHHFQNQYQSNRPSNQQQLHNQQYHSSSQYQQNQQNYQYPTQYQQNQQNYYEQKNTYQHHTAKRPGGSRVRFGNDNQDIVVKHEHHHYHHHQHNERHKDNGISFGYTDGPYFRTLNLTDEENQVKRNTKFPSGEGDKEGFQFPKSRSLNKRDADELSIAPAKDIQPVGTSNHNSTLTKFTFKSQSQNDNNYLSIHIYDLQRQHHHFGPNGFKPPTCGGPASGYVCCRVAASNNGFTQFVTSPSNTHHSLHKNPSNQVNHVGNLLSGSNRPSREQQSVQQQFSNFGQCGKKNAKGLTGRVANNQFREGDTDFGKFQIECPYPCDLHLW